LTRFLARRSTAYLALTVAAASWAGNWVVARGLHQLFPPVTLAFWRWACACIVLAPIAMPQVRRDWPLVREYWARMLGFGAIGTTTFAVLGYWGLQYTSGMNAVLLNAATPVFTMLIGVIVLGEAFNLRLAAAVAAAVAATALLACQADPQRLLAAQFNRGDLILLVAMFVWSAYTVALRWRPPGVHGLSFLFMSSLIGVGFCLPLYLLELHSGARPDLTPGAIAGVAYLTVFPSVIAYVCYNYAVPKVGHNVAGVFSNVTAVLGTAGSIAFLGEEPHWYHLAALGLVCVAVYLASWRPR
jgi:drug/metabolite transporter (DMT)-like permease